MSDSFFVTKKKKSGGKQWATSQKRKVPTGGVDDQSSGNKGKRRRVARTSRQEALDEELDDSVDGGDFFVSEKEMRKEKEKQDAEPEADPYADETPGEKRVRLAKEYLDKLAALDSSDGEEDSEEDEQDEFKKIEGLLQLDAFRARTGRNRRGKNLSGRVDVSIAADSILRKRGHQLSLTAIVVNDESTLFYTASKDCNIVKWDCATFKKLHTFKGHRTKTVQEGHHTNQVLALALSSDGKLLASGGMDKDNSIRIWDTEKLSLRYVFKGHRDAITCLVFRQGTHDLYSGSNDRTIKVWNCDTNAYIDTLFGHQDPVTGIASLRRERCISSSFDKTTRSYKILEETQLVMRGPGSSQDCICHLTEDVWLTGASNGSLYAWDTKHKKPIGEVKQAHGTNWISSVASIPYTDLVATGSCDGFIRLWKVASGGRKISAITSIPLVGWINALKFLPSGASLIAGVGQEHRLGRWWRLKEAKNTIAIIPIGAADTTLSHSEKLKEQDEAPTGEDGDAMSE